MSDDEQSPGSMSLRMGKKKDGPNWFMIAGGAVVMAVSVAFGRKKILNEGEKTKERPPNAVPRSRAASHDDDETASVHTYETVHNGTPFWDKSGSAAQSPAEFEFRSFKTKRPAPNDPSPQVSKFCRQLSHNSVCQSNKEPVPSDSHTSTALRAGLTARREMVHRLRQQIRSRDAMIYDMQTQLSDQDQIITMHRNHCADLQECVQAISAKLFEANLEVQRLHREIIAQRAQPIVDLDEECIDIAVSEMKGKWKDIEEIILEARRLNEKVERLEREKEEKDNLAQAKSRQCESLSKKVSSLATELEDVKSAAHGKQRLLELKEQENLKLTSVLRDLLHKLEIESRDNEWARNSKLSRRTDTCNVKSSLEVNHNIDQPVTLDYEEVSSTCIGNVDGNYHQAGSLRKPYASVHARNDSQQDSEVSVAKAESRCISDAHTKRCEVPSEQDDGVIDEALILEYGKEMDQVASGLSVTSKVVSEKMQAASRILMGFQEHSEFRIDAQSNVKGANISQVFSCLSEGMSAEQRQELRNELEQVAKQQDVEREMKALTKHRTKLEELKSAVAKVSARFHAQNTEDDTSNTDVLQLASSLSGIEQKLAIQEVIVKETSLFIQQLSALFPIPSPHNPPVQEIQRMVKETSGNITSPNQYNKKSVGSVDENSRNASQSRVEEDSTRILERQDSSSNPKQYFNPSRNNAARQVSSPVKLLDKPFQFQFGASDGPVSTSRTRTRSPLGAARTSFRKPAVHHKNMVGSKRQSNCVGESSKQTSRDGASFRPDSAVTSGFSFGSSASDRPLEKAGMSNQYPQTAESGVQQLEAIVERAQPYEQEQGDRMSSPEPEPYNTHMFRAESTSFNTSEQSGSTPTFPKRFRTQSGSETLSPANLNSMQPPAYDVSRHSPASGRFHSPQSPCFGDTLDKTSSRRPLFGSTSLPLSASSNLRLDSDISTSDLRKLNFAQSTDEDRDFQIKRLTEEISRYDSNPDCLPRLRDVNSAHPSGSPVGVLPFAARMACLDVRQPGSPMGSLRNLETRGERENGFSCREDEDEDDEEVSHQSVHSRVTNWAEARQFHLFNRDLGSKDSLEAATWRSL